jgi:SAM-dependent methyltransferase
MTKSGTKKRSRKQLGRWLYRWLSPMFDPLRLLRALNGYRRYFADWRSYRSLPGAETIRWQDTWPQLHDRTTNSPIDPHYFFVNGWATRRILGVRPARHVDLASQTVFANLLSASLPVLYVDYRPLVATLQGLTSAGATILQLPFAANSIESLSCLHVAEHIGLGRYGDPLDPAGTRKAAVEMARVLAPGGNLYFAVPVGKPRLCFNSCRIFAPELIGRYFSRLELVEFSGVHDDGRFVEHVELAEFRDSEYACGMFWFRKGV